MIVKEFLHLCLGRLESRADFEKKMRITNLCFSDDLLWFARGDVTSFLTEFQRFSEATGKIANKAKCNVYCGGMGERLGQ